MQPNPIADTLTPLLPTLNVLSSKIKIEVRSVNKKDEG